MKKKGLPLKMSNFRDYEVWNKEVNIRFLWFVSHFYPISKIRLSKQGIFVKMKNDLVLGGKKW